MASCLKSRTGTLLSQKPWVLSTFFTERWFGRLPNQDHLAHNAKHLIVGDTALTTDGLSASFSTCLGLTNKPVVMNVPSNIFYEKHKPQQDQENELSPKNIQDVLRTWGCNNEETSQILECVPSLHKTRLDILQSKLHVLRDLKITPSDLVKIVGRKSRFFRFAVNKHFDERMRYLEQLFGSKERLKKAIVRDPSVVTYDLETVIKPAVELYESMGITGQDLSLILVSRPTIIPRTSLNAEKLEYIRKTGISKDSKMYKYVVMIMAISRLESIREKVTNFEKFGILEDELLRLMCTAPLVFSLSVDKVQRNMTFLVATMKQPAKAVLKCPFLICCNMETVLKPRMILAAKIDDMGLGPSINGPRVFTALRMTEKRFVEVFICCHPPEIANELMHCFEDAKRVKRLANEAKQIVHKGLPY